MGSKGQKPERWEAVWNWPLCSGVLGDERDTSRFGVFVALTRKHQMNSRRAMCTVLCMHERVNAWACMCAHAGMCVRVCVSSVRVCEQVAGIFEDDSRGLTHARLNKAALWWSLCDTPSQRLWGPPSPCSSNTPLHTCAQHTLPHFPSGALCQIARAALWLPRVCVRSVCGPMTTHSTNY